MVFTVCRTWILFEMVQPVSNGSIAVSLQVFIMESKNCEEAPCRQMGVLHAKEPSLYMIKYLKTKIYLKKKLWTILGSEGMFNYSKVWHEMS